VFFMGSASRFPHMQGGFADYVLVDESQCYPVSLGLPFTTAAFAEPLAVALHAVERAGPMLGRSMLITGSGPIGLLVLLAARRAGAETICITDILDEPLALAQQIGADMTINVGQGGGSLEQEIQRNAGFEVAFEVSGNPAGLGTCLEAVRSGATVVQVGTLPPGPFPVAGNLVMAKEIDLRGAMRFDREFAHSVACLDRGLVDVTPLLTARVPAEEASAAFDLAKQRDKHSKVQLTF
jgi:L-idonate 5-dehydrogenase